jgi:predicted DNA-binding protein
MKGITIKLPEEILRGLRQEARATGRSIAELVRERVEARPHGKRESIYALTSDLAGVLDGSRKSASNARRRFRRR